MARRFALKVVAGFLAAAALGSAALASGVYQTLPWCLDQYGGDLPDRQARYDGRLGVVMAHAPDSHLFMAWRLLHGLPVGREIGAKLEVPCCSRPYDADAPISGVNAWLESRKIVPGAAVVESVATGRDGPDYTVIDNCFDGAFDTAARTLKDRADAHGAASPEVAAWLKTQDVVFEACAKPEAKLPPATARPPVWLAQDRAYQEAAFSLYQGQYADAASRFAAIGRDAASPWRGLSPYLIARSQMRAALVERTDASYERARLSLEALGDAPAGTFGMEDALGLMRVIKYRLRPDDLLKEEGPTLNARVLIADAAVAFRDVNMLGRTVAQPPEMVDWIRTLKPRPAPPADSEKEITEADSAKSQRDADLAALAHARQRWGATRDPAWLVAALSLIDPGQSDARALIADADRVAPNSPAWLTAQYHAIRLSLPDGDPTVLRPRLDALLARTDLSVSDRNLFTAQRAQVAADLDDFSRFALRKRLCIREDYEEETDKEKACVREYWFESAELSGIFDRDGRKGVVGLGEDARAVIDRLPLADRQALARNASLPAKHRLDISLTNFTRAVQLQNNAAIDAAAGDLTVLLPQMAADWRTLMAAKPGPAKRFAEFYILAKVPSLRIDLVDYRRPEGATVAQFQGTWVDWIVPAAGRPPGGKSPALTEYQQDGLSPPFNAPDSATDLTCLGECGRGAAPLRMPDFAAAGQTQAAKERAYFWSAEHGYDADPPPVPPGAVAAWDEMLTFAAANPNDPRTPQALYWLVRVGRWGGSHDHSGRRAFKLLHARYPASDWAKRSPYYYD